MPFVSEAVQRISPPNWASVPIPKVADDFESNVFDAIQERRELLLNTVHGAVVEYLTNADLCFDDDTFPSTQDLTGEYYVAEQSYIWYPKWQVFYVAVMARCLGVVPGTESLEDYLGLEVHLQWLPESASFVTWRNTDSSVICPVLSLGGVAPY